MPNDTNDNTRFAFLKFLAEIVDYIRIKKQATIREDANSATIAKSTQTTADTARSKFRFETIYKILRDIGGLIRRLFSSAAYPLWKNAAPYIILILILYIIFVGIGIPNGPKLKLPKSIEKDRQAMKQQTNKIANAIKRFFQMLFAPNHQVRMMLQKVNVFGGNIETQARPRLASGRCDNVVWREVGNDGAKGFCAKTYSPKDIAWTLNVDKMPELSKLPKDLAKKLRGEEDGVATRMQVYIPWEKQGTFYVPQCRKAYFMDKNKSSAAYLFEDGGLDCKKVEFSVKAVESEYRPKDAKTKDDYATPEDPKCDL